jgi:hypothetical protein
MMGRKALILLMATGMLGGCYSFRGPEPVFSSRGIVYRDRHDVRAGYLFERFRQAAAEAAGCTETVTPRGETAASPIDQRIATCQPDDSAPPSVREARVEQFMLTGYALVYSDCADYFAVMGRNQGRTRILRDAIGPIANLITGIVALRGNTAGAIPELALFNAATTSTLDIYEQRFLFDADNIDAVRQLVLRGISEHATATLRGTNLTFEQGAINVLDNQALCTPSKVLTLTRSAIREARLDARTAAAPDPATNAAAAGPPPPPPPAGTAAPGLRTTLVSVTPQ